MFDDRTSSRYGSVELTGHKSRNSRASLKLLGFSLEDYTNASDKFKPKLKEKYRPKKIFDGNEMAPGSHDWLFTPLFG